MDDDKKIKMMMIRDKLVQVLERGKESANQMRKLLDHDHRHHQGQLDAPSLVVLTSFSTALSMLHHFDHHFKSEDFDEWDPPKTPSKDGRGCYKRRKIGDSEATIVTTNTDDGHAWRKYGQKAIQHTKHPRNYYRCTHKSDQGCLATKQIQQVSENPTKYKVIYHGHHSCKNPLQTPPMLLDLIDDHDSKSSILLNFGTANSNNPKHDLSPFMVSSSPSPSSSSPPSPSASASASYDHHHGDYFQLPEVYSSAASPTGIEEHHSYIMDPHESFDISELFQDYLDHDLDQDLLGCVS